MKELVENPNSEALKPLAEAMFFHFIELEKSTRSFTALKFLANPDTKTEKTLNEIRSKISAIEELKESTTLKEGTVDALLNSVLGSFFNKNIISDLIEPLFELTNNPEVSDFIDSKIKLNPIDISKMFGKGIDGHNRFIKDFKKAIPNYIYQNYRSNFVDGKGNIVSLPTEYNGYTVKEKKGVKNGVEIDNKILYVDSEALKNEFDNDLFLRDNADDLGYTKMGLRGFDVSLKIFPNESSYFKYVFERESLRKMFPFKTINLNNEFKNINKNISDPNEAYESFLNQNALINAYNRVGLMELNTQSYTDQVLNIIAEFPALKNKYSILQQLTRVPAQIKENILTINEPKSLKDSSISDTFYENLIALGDVNVKKVKNIKDNKRISDIFSKLPSIMLYQHGVGYSKHGFTKALPYDDFINIMQPASKIFINNQLNEETLQSIYNMLMASDKSFVNYVVSSKEYNDANVSKSVNITPAEAKALLESGSIGVDEDIDDEEQSTQPSTIASELLESIERNRAYDLKRGAMLGSDGFWYSRSKEEINAFYDNKILNAQASSQPSTDVNDKLSNIQTGSRPDVNLREKYFKNSDVVKVSEVLNKIAESNHPLNKLAQHLKSFANINNTDIALYNQISFNNNPNFLSGGYYDIINNSISIAEFANVKNGQSETILLHEILHALSYKALRNNNEFNKDFKKLYDSTIEQLGMYNAESLEGLYGTYTIDEFFVALFTDSKFIKELENLAPIDIKNYNNMFEEIFDYILKLLNITKNSSLYSQAFSVASNILEDTNNQTSMIDSVDNINDNSLNYNKPEGLPAIDRTSTECS